MVLSVDREQPPLNLVVVWTQDAAVAAAYGVDALTLPAVLISTSQGRCGVLFLHTEEVAGLTPASPTLSWHRSMATFRVREVAFSLGHSS